MDKSPDAETYLVKPSNLQINAQPDRPADLLTLRFEAIRWGRIAARLKKRLHDAEVRQDRAFALAQNEEARLILKTTGEIDI